MKTEYKWLILILMGIFLAIMYSLSEARAESTNDFNHLCSPVGPVGHEDNKFGQESYGWEDLDKITLFKDGSFGSHATKEEIEWCEKVAKVVCEALNNAGL